MKTVLYMGITVNGAIARADGTVDWNSEPGWKSFYDHGTAAGNFIMGANTFLVGVQDGTFPFGDVLNVVMTHQPVENRWGERVIFTDKEPSKVLEMLKEKGFETALLIGGGKLNAAFAKEHLIDEMYFDVEPIVFGKGIPLFGDENFELKLKYLGLKSLNENTIQLHYKVIK